MPKPSKNYIIIITLSVISLILGGTFFAISQNDSKQILVSNSISTGSSSSSSVSIYSQNSQTVNSTNLPTNQTSNLQTYTNPNYPSLKINYDDSWEIEKKVLEDGLNDQRLNMNFQSKNRSDNQKLQSEQIILSKNETKLKVFLQMSTGFYTDNQYDAFGDLGSDKITRAVDHAYFIDLGAFTRSLQHYYDDGQLQKIIYKYFFKENPNSCSNARTKNFSNRTIKTNISINYKEILPTEFKKATSFEEIGDISCDNKLLFNLEVILDSDSESDIIQAEKIIKNSTLQ